MDPPGSLAISAQAVAGTPGTAPPTTPAPPLTSLDVWWTNLFPSIGIATAPTFFSYISSKAAQLATDELTAGWGTGLSLGGAGFSGLISAYLDRTTPGYSTGERIGRTVIDVGSPLAGGLGLGLLGPEGAAFGSILGVAVGDYLDTRIWGN